MKTSHASVEKRRGVLIVVNYLAKERSSRNNLSMQMFPINPGGFSFSLNAAGNLIPQLMMPRVLVPQPGSAQSTLLQAQAQAAVAAALRPQPMLVPPGMGISDVVAASPSPVTAPPAPSSAPGSASAGEWSEHVKEGRKFYYNKVTKQSVWHKPPELLSPAERAASMWKEYATNDGRCYYYNTESKETTWTKPEGFIPTSSAHDSKPAGLSGNAEKTEVKQELKEVKKEDEPSDLDKAINATLASIGSTTSSSNVSLVSDVPMLDEQAELKKRQADRFQELLRDKYNDGKITSTCTWDQAAKYIQNDPRFRILTKVSEKKQLFNAWKVQRQKEERDQRTQKIRVRKEVLGPETKDERRVAIKKAKEDLEKWLLEQPRMKVHLRYQKADDIFGNESVWKAVCNSDRKEIFREAQMQMSKKEDETQKETAKRNVQALNDILENMSEITYRTTWAQAQRLLIENPHFADDVTLQSMDKMDALIVFEKHIKNLEKQYEEEKENEERRLRRRERKTREAFQQLLHDLHQRGELTSVSLWSTLYTRIASDNRFDSMLQQSGSTPLDLFKFFVEDLKEQFGQDRKVIKEILATKNLSVTVSTSLDELVSWVQEDEKGKDVDMGNLKLCYNSLLDKAESKEKELEREEARKKRRLQTELRSLLRTVQPPIEPTTEWAQVRSKIENETAFKAILIEEERQEIFGEYVKGLAESCGHHHSAKKKKKEKKKKKDAEESDGETKAKKKKKKHEKDTSEDEKEKKKRKKEKKRRPSHSPSPKRSNSESD